MKHELTANRLRDALEVADMLPVELSQRSGVSQSSISQYLNGSHAPSNVSSGKMADVLKCSPVWLMGFDVPRYEEAPPERTLRPDESSLLSDYNRLNPLGRDEASKRVKELTQIESYIKDTGSQSA